ncbi:MAG: hypothetical protein WDN02_05170 [Methylovirgula sp.]|uniref:hypothetical protein n=1 Tax=Methylovirgula sp. TaxID=1978224 RepID=UPI0030763F69
MRADTDTDFFRKTPGANYRVRDARPGEVEELMRRMLPAGAVVAGEFIAPETAAFAVMAMKIDRKTIVRLLVVKTPGWKEPPADAFGVHALVLGHKLPIDVKAGW